MPYYPRDAAPYPTGPASHAEEAGRDPAQLQDAARSASDALNRLVTGLGNLGLDEKELRDLRQAQELASRLTAKLTPRVGEDQRDELRVTLTPRNFTEAAHEMLADVNRRSR
jgi:hypothetical protein